MGTVITKNLTEGEVILVDSDSLLCFEKSVSINVKSVGGLCTMLCAGEGLFHTELTGPGTVWMQSMSIDKLRKLFPPKVVQSNGGGDGGGDDGGGGDGGGE